VFAWQQFKAQTFEPITPVRRVLEKRLPQVVTLFHKIDRGDSGGANGRRQRVGEQIGSRPLAQQVDDGLRPGDVAADGTAKRLAERAGEDLDPFHAEMVRRAAALWSHEARGVAVVDHDDGIVTLCQRGDLRQRGEVAVHGKHAIGRDHDATRAIGPGFAKLCLQVVHIGICVAVAPGLAQSDAVDDRGVVQRVGDDRVLGAEKGLEQAAIGIETGGEQDRVVLAEELASRISSARCRSWVPQMKRTLAMP
jgi:hypothetical protein